MSLKSIFGDAFKIVLAWVIGLFVITFSVVLLVKSLERGYNSTNAEWILRVITSVILFEMGLMIVWGYGYRPRVQLGEHHHIRNMEC